MNSRFWTGIALILVSFTQLFLPEEYATFIPLTFFWSAFMIGVILVGEGLTTKLQNKSLLKTVTKSPKTLLLFTVVSTIGAICLEGIAQWIGKLWYYPYFSNWIYLLVFVPGFVLYWLMISESYLGAKAIIDNYRKTRHIVTKYYSYESHLYPVLALIGVASISAAITCAYIAYYNNGGYSFNISSPTSLYINFFIIISLFIGVWFLAEYFEYRKRKSSLIKDLLHHYRTPLIAIILGAITLALLMEISNLTYGYWEYINWPLSQHNIFGLPVVMIFFAWPLHYVMFLSVFRAITPAESIEIWRCPQRLTKKNHRCL